MDRRSVAGVTGACGVTPCQTFIAYRLPDDLGPCWSYILTQGQMFTLGLATAAGIGFVLLSLAWAVRAVVRG